MHQPSTIYSKSNYRQTFNWSSIVLPEISLGKGRLLIIINHSPNQPLTLQAQFDATEPQLHTGMFTQW